MTAYIIHIDKEALLKTKCLRFGISYFLTCTTFVSSAALLSIHRWCHPMQFNVDLEFLRKLHEWTRLNSSWLVSCQCFKLLHALAACEENDDLCSHRCDLPQGTGLACANDDLCYRCWYCSRWSLTAVYRIPRVQSVGASHIFWVDLNFQNFFSCLFVC